VWLVVILLSLYLVTITLEKFTPRLRAIFAILLIGESLLLSWTYLAKQPFIPPYISNETISQINEDQETFRIFCLTRCISQQQAALYSLELVDGYSTLIQQNYNRQFWGFTKNYWTYYTLALPPMGLYTNTKIDPDSESLGDYNTKYIISPYALLNSHYKLNFEKEGYYIYRNTQFHPRAYFADVSGKEHSGAVIISRTPNEIVIDVTKKEPTATTLIVSEVYSEGWRAFTEDGKKLEVLETPNGLRAVPLDSSTQMITLYYKPDSIIVGLIMTFVSTIILLSLI
jgi:hypothetical protein